MHYSMPAAVCGPKGNEMRLYFSNVKNGLRKGLAEERQPHQPQGAIAVAIELDAETEHGFDEPLRLMTDCHRRIERALGVLEKVAQDGHDTLLSDEHRRAVELALKYFDSAVPQHQEDEERSLFPLLRASNLVETRTTWQQLAALETEHAISTSLHVDAKLSFRRWLDLARLEAPQRRRLNCALRCLREIYQRHIELEERKVFPLAGSVLTQDQLDQLGREMAERRGLAPVTV